MDSQEYLERVISSRGLEALRKRLEASETTLDAQTPAAARPRGVAPWEG
jgi:hypothetical protein